MKENLQIAFLVLAHNQPGHLNRLINTLTQDNVHFFIHLDKKSDITEFQKYDYPTSAHFIEDRISVHHEGFSLAQAMTNLLKEAFKEQEVDYFFFLSGWDYPIKNNAYISDFLNKHYPMNFINFYPLVGDAKFVNNIRRYCFRDFIGSAPRILIKPLKLLQRIVWMIPLNRPFIPGLIPFRGSNWSCLSRATISYILDFLGTDDGVTYTKFFRNVNCPDEIFFQTIVLNSRFAEYCHLYEEFIKNLRYPLKIDNNAYLHYIDWNPKRENPAQFDLSDFEKLRDSEALFARKFNEKKSKQLLLKIDQTIRINHDETVF